MAVSWRTDCFFPLSAPFRISPLNASWGARVEPYRRLPFGEHTPQKTSSFFRFYYGPFFIVMGPAPLPYLLPTVRAAEQ